MTTQKTSADNRACIKVTSDAHMISERWRVLLFTIYVYPLCQSGFECDKQAARPIPARTYKSPKQLRLTSYIASSTLGVREHGRRALAASKPPNARARTPHDAGGLESQTTACRRPLRRPSPSKGVGRSSGQVGGAPQKAAQSSLGHAGHRLRVMHRSLVGEWRPATSLTAAISVSWLHRRELLCAPAALRPAPLARRVLG